MEETEIEEDGGRETELISAGGAYFHHVPPFSCELGLAAKRLQSDDQAWRRTLVPEVHGRQRLRPQRQRALSVMLNSSREAGRIKKRKKWLTSWLKEMAHFSVNIVFFLFWDV